MQRVQVRLRRVASLAKVVCSVLVHRRKQLSVPTLGFVSSASTTVLKHTQCVRRNLAMPSFSLLYIFIFCMRAHVGNSLRTHDNDSEKKITVQLTRKKEDFLLQDPLRSFNLAASGMRTSLRVESVGIKNSEKENGG